MNDYKMSEKPNFLRPHKKKKATQQKLCIFYNKEADSCAACKELICEYKRCPFYKTEEKQKEQEELLLKRVVLNPDKQDIVEKYKIAKPKENSK